MEKRFFNNWRIGLILVFAFSVVLYLPSLLGGSIWDDDDLLKGSGIGGGTLVGAFTKPFLGHYFRPLTSVSFVVDNLYARNTPFYYHQTNVLLHAATAVLVCCLALLVTESALAGILSGLFFATQPMQVGATAWIGGRTDVLSAFFIGLFLVSLVSYHKSAKWPWMGIAVLTYFLAALSKEQAVTILLAVPLSVYVFGSRKSKDALKLTVPFAVVAVCYFTIWALLLPAPATAQFTFVRSVRLFTLTAAHYGMAVLTPNRPFLITFTLENYTNPLWIGVGLAVIGGVLYTAWASWNQNRAVFWLLACAFFVYLPVGNFPPVPSFLIGPYRIAESGPALACLLGIAGASCLATKRYFLAGLLVANLVGGFLITRVGIQLWQKPMDLFQAISKNDSHFMVGVGNYSHALDGENRSAEAMRWTDGTLQWLFGTKNWLALLQRDHQKALTPQVVDRLLTNAGGETTKILGWFVGCYGASLATLKRFPEARAVEKEAVLLAPKDARLNYAYGILLLDVDRPLGIHYLEVGVHINPGYTACATALAHERVKDKRYADAIKLLEPVMTNAAWNAEVWLDLADSKIALHDYPGALKALAGADSAIMPAKDKIAIRRKLLAALMAAPKSSPPKSTSPKLP